MAGNELLLGGLLAVNGALFALLVFITFRKRRWAVEPRNLEEAFRELEFALLRAVPDLPSGFTWEEAVERLRSSGLQTESMEEALKGYEAYRYGGTPIPAVDYGGVVRVTKVLGERAPVRRGGGAILGR